MTYGSLENIYDAKARTLTALAFRTAGLNSAQGQYRVSSGAWSAAETLEHLLLVETQILRMITTLLTRAEDAGTPAGDTSYAVDVDILLERSRKERYLTRKSFQPSGAVSVRAALDGLMQIDESFRKLQPRLSAVEPRQTRFPHWIFGPLDLAQWLAFLALHEERHLLQIEHTLAHVAFPAGG